MPACLEVVYEDNHLLVVNKPYGLLSQGDASGRPSLDEVAKSYLKDRYQKPGNVYLGLIHRLDRVVGGLMVLARTSKAASRLSAQMRAGTIRKIYRGLVEGQLQARERRLEGWLERVGDRSVVRAHESPGAQAASLSFSATDTGQGTSRVEVILETGRKHQIRAMFAHLGHPILGDQKYGSRQTYRPDGICLWSSELCFHHPTRNDEISFELAPPLDWEPLRCP